MSKMSLKELIRIIGPGILFAGAAIGGSHLIQSTRAGASYGTELIWAVLLANLFKYPFFEYGHRFTAATGKSILEGYREMGSWALIVFFLLSTVTAIINYAAVTLATSGLAMYFFGISVNPVYVSIALLLFAVGILLVGKYSLLDKIVKFMVLTLSISTFTAFILAYFNYTAPTIGIHPEAETVLTGAGFAFLIALMGWMPAPIEASVWTSLWALEKGKEIKKKPNIKDALMDFNIGYLVTALMALLFLGLGAMLMHNSGIIFEKSGVAFSKQLVSIYTNTLGQWSHFIISMVVFLTMLSTTFTVVDAYPRSLQGTMHMIWSGFNKKKNFLYWLWILALSIISIVIIADFANTMTTLLDIAMIVSFLAAPVFAIINFKVVMSDQVDEKLKPGKFLRILSYSGIIFLSLFSLVYIYSIIFK